jgi:hypothetical protein
MQFPGNYTGIACIYARFVSGLARHDPGFPRFFAPSATRARLEDIDIRGFNSRTQISGAVIAT